MPSQVLGITKEIQMNYWADITGNALSSLNTLKEFGLSPDSPIQQIADQLKEYAASQGYPDSLSDDEEPLDADEYYRIAVELRNEAAAERLVLD
jgi:hypothetical protein